MKKGKASDTLLRRECLEHAIAIEKHNKYESPSMYTQHGGAHRNPPISAESVIQIAAKLEAYVRGGK